MGRKRNDEYAGEEPKTEAKMDTERRRYNIPVPEQHEVNFRTNQHATLNPRLPSGGRLQEPAFSA